MDIIINVSQIKYNRNGVGGEEFYSVEFTTPNEDMGGNSFFIGIVPAQAVTKKEYRADIYVITPDNLDHAWRGADFYGKQLIDFIIDYRGYEED